jgi:PAS domain S-box-containing protein
MSRPKGPSHNKVGARSVSAPDPAPLDDEPLYSGLNDRDLAAVVHASGHVSWTAFPDGTGDQLASWQAYTGQTRSETQRDGWLSAIDPTDRTRVAEAMALAAAMKQLCELEFRLCRSDGASRTVRFRAVPKLNAGGSVDKWYCFCVDITGMPNSREFPSPPMPVTNAGSSILQAVLDTLPIGLYVSDGNGKLLHRNAMAARIWGEQSPRVDVIDQYPVYTGWWLDSGKAVSAREWALARALETGESVVDDQVSIESFDGERKSIGISATPIRDVDGTIVAGVVVIEDITDRIRLQNALGQTTLEASARLSQLEAIFEGISDGLLVCDAEGIALHVNAAYRRLMGVPDDDSKLVRHPDARARLFFPRDSRGNLLPPDQRPVARILRGETLTEANTSDYMVRTADGREILLSASGAPVRDAHNAIIGAVAIFRDVTERRTLERQTGGALSALLTIAESLVTQDTERDEGDIDPTTAGRRMAERIAHLARSVLGCQVVVLATCDAQLELTPLAGSWNVRSAPKDWWIADGNRQVVAAISESAVIDRLHSGTVVALDLPASLKDFDATPSARRCILVAPMRIGQSFVGVMVIEHGTVPHTYSTSERMLTGAIANLTGLLIERARLRREQARAEARELALRETNRRMNEFLGIAGHELRTPLTSISAGIQLAERRVKRALDEAAGSGAGEAVQITFAADILGRVLQQTRRLDRLISDLLDVSRIQADRLELRISPRDLVPLVKDVVHDQRQLEPTRVVKLSISDAEAIRVMADGDRIVQVVTNYLTNALKYSEIDAEVDVRVETQGSDALVFVTDRGPGLAPEEMEHIWERFYRAPSVEVQSGSGVGLGLGLHISATIIARHGGKVGVESAKGRGSTFWFSLPLIP